MTSIINSTSISYEAIRDDLTNHVKTIENYTDNWKDFYEGGAGSTVIQLLAGLGSFLSHAAHVNRREAYLDTATLRSSIVAISTTLGYNVNRPTAPVLKLSLNVDTNQFILKTTSIGEYNNLTLSLLEDKTLLTGSNVVNVALGEWKIFNYTATNPKEFSHVLVPDLVDNNLYELTVNGNRVDIVRNAEELTPNNILIRSFINGIFLIWGDGVLGRALLLDDEIVFKYIKPNTALLENVINIGDINLDINATVSLPSIETYGTFEDPNNKLKGIASGYFTTKRRLITLSDYDYIGASYNGIVSVAARKQAGSCCIIELAYITDSYRPLLPTERINYLAYLANHKIIGTEIILVDSVHIDVTVSLVIIINPTANTDTIRNLITEYLNTQCYKLNKVFSISGLFTIGLTDISRLYIKSPIIDKQARFNEYFVLKALNIEFSTNQNLIESNGTDISIGYSA